MSEQVRSMDKTYKFLEVGKNRTSLGNDDIILAVKNSMYLIAEELAELVDALFVGDMKKEVGDKVVEIFLKKLNAPRKDKPTPHEVLDALVDLQVVLHNAVFYLFLEHAFGTALDAIETNNLTKVINLDEGYTAETIANITSKTLEKYAGVEEGVMPFVAFGHLAFRNKTGKILKPSNYKPVSFVLGNEIKGVSAFMEIYQSCRKYTTQMELALSNQENTTNDESTSVL
jgi:hypothetical protein